ncbi:MAG: bifunctional diaminohydroxyphosphoribosylaminopyrimidine deaminase/5-amino-6-(5-phosphoribosylamino)uracil reductase RibD [Muribaculaceae bacterium]|nr:bifunctional diaminohydroxyphosphoribosylaminopyrimidine deaminase/5-amino-6-(5-phosphoribosylamino)uracil reductase RibD [Muribaculaceae bacterium]
MGEQKKFSSPEEKYMRRALELATYGAGFVSPNPMVGAVIVSRSGRIIGEGWHRKYGCPHAEVNAVNSVSSEDEHLLPEATIYVTLEPCSHYGKTPPCSLLLINKGIGRVVVGSPDPFPLVAGRGIKMLREAGIEVVENFLQKECDFLNRRFLTAHTLQRPYILLKWAESSDGFMAPLDDEGNSYSVKISTPLTSRLMHKERAVYDAVMIGTDTVLIDNPTLTTRLWPGTDARPVIFTSSRVSEEAEIMKRNPIVLPSSSLPDAMCILYKEFGVTSLMVEGGAKLLSSFLKENLFNEIRQEISNVTLNKGIPAPSIPSLLTLMEEKILNSNIIRRYIKAPSTKILADIRPF